MKAKEYLKQLGLLDTRINNLQRELNRLRDLSQDIQGIDYSTPRVQVSSPGDAIGKNIARCLHLEQEVEEEIKRFAVLKHNIVRQVNSLDNAVFVKILFLRYVEFKKLTEVAAAMGYSYQYVKELHGYALKSFMETHPELFKN